MQNKKLLIGIIIGFVLVAAAAFLGGRFLNFKVGPMGLFPGNGDRVQVSIQRTPAPELPEARADLTGLFVSRSDNTITVQSMNSMAIKVVKTGDDVNVSPADGNEGPKVEVVITGQTKVWHDTTQIDGPPASGEIGVQQTVEEGNIDDLTSQTMIMVWGRKNGDRIIADVISYSNPVMFKRP